MNTAEISTTLTTLFSELVNGAPQAGAYMLNAGDEGLLRALEINQTTRGPVEVSR